MLNLVWQQKPGHFLHYVLARVFHELLWRDHEDGNAIGQPCRGIDPEAQRNGTSQGELVCLR